MATQQQQRPGAVRVGGPGEHRKRGGWWKWLLALLAVVALIALLAALLGGDDDSGATSAGTGPTSQGESGTAKTTSGAGTLTAGGQSLLPPEAGLLEGRVEEQAKGDNVQVVKVNEGEGFWVGTSTTERVYVEYGGDVGENEAEGFTAKVGDQVNLTGPVRPAPQDPMTALNLQDEADARLVTEQGGFVNADTVERAG